MPTLHDTVAQAYKRHVRPRLPVRRRAVWNGVEVDVGVRALDRWLPEAWGAARDEPAYESALADGLRRHVRPGDRVVVVGGGWGVTAVIAAQAAGPDGRVWVYEGATEGVERTRWAARNAGVSGRVEASHALVAADDYAVEASRVLGSGGGAARLAPRDLPPCDVLELDCEGAETGVLSGLAQRPRVVLVETHGFWGSPTAEVRGLLGRLGYRVVSEAPAESRIAAFCVERDVFVLEAVHRPTP